MVCYGGFQETLEGTGQGNVFGKFFETHNRLYLKLKKRKPGSGTGVV